MGAVFALMGGFVNWFPLIVGLTINPKWLKVQFMIIFLGVNMSPTISGNQFTNPPISANTA